MYLTRVNRKTLVLIAAGAVFLIILALALIFFSDFFLKNNGTEIEGPVGAGDDVLPAMEAKVPRTQEEIAIEYSQNIKRLLGALQTAEGASAEIFSMVEAGFFDIFVPNDLRDLHIQTLLRIQKIKVEEKFDSAEAVKEGLSPLLENLLDKNESQ